MTIPRIRSSLVLKTTLLVLGVALGIGLVANEVAGRLARRYESERVRIQIGGLLAVVEPSASAACFVGDQRLALETAKGLLNSPTIAAVEIRGMEGVLAEVQRPGTSLTGLRIVHGVPSPFAKDQRVGEIRVIADPEETERRVARSVWTLRAAVLLLAAMMGAALALAVMRMVVRPIKQISDRLNGLDASRGARLDSPPGHALDEIGRLVGDVNVALDSVEERRRLEREIQQAQKLNSLGHLAGGIAHDFNNMLAGIMGSTDLLLADEPDPKRQKHLRSILGASMRSSELITKLLAFGRRGKNLAEAVDLGAAVAECLALLRPSMHPDLAVRTDLRPGLSIDGDPSQVQQVLMNLFLNAIEAMPGGGVLTITTRTVQLGGTAASSDPLPAGSYAELAVADTGPGMDPELLQRIFDPFMTTKTRKGQPGTGLGLSTVLGIVEAHFGAISVDSTIGRGSTFRVLLPVGRLLAEPVAAESEPRRGEGLVLVVEDEPIVREVTRSALERLGYTVETAQDGQEGVAAYRARHHTLMAVLLDLKMPVLDGREAFEQMQRIDAEVPIIICTGYGENEEVQAILSQGGAGMLNKPYRIADLSEVLRRLGGSS